MRSCIRWLFILGCALAAAPASAGRIGFVDAERAVITVQEGKRKVRELEAWAEPERKRVEELRGTVAEMRQRLARQRAVASPDVVQQLEEEELTARRQFEDAARRFERDLDSKQNEFLADVAVKVGTVASDYGRANDFEAIFVLTAQPLIFVAESADLTEIVIRLYDERFPASPE